MTLIRHVAQYYSQMSTPDAGQLRKVAQEVFAGNSIFILLTVIFLALVLGKIIAIFLRRLSRVAGRSADASADLQTVNRMRGIETWLILSIAVARVLIFIAGLYIWWVITHPNQQPTALVGASALIAIVLGGVFGPLLRDFAFGGSMMAEHWFGVGDLITIEPFTTIQGVVERITLRSTRIRGLNGEVIWISNQNIQGVRIAQKGVWTMAIELFANDNVRLEHLLERVNQLLPTGPSLLVRPLAIIKQDERSKGVWHITAIGEIAPGREWLIEKTAIDLLKKLDEKQSKPVLLSDPVARYADNDTERQFARAVNNAKKTKRAPRKLALAGVKPKTRGPQK